MAASAQHSPVNAQVVGVDGSFDAKATLAPAFRQVYESQLAIVWHLLRRLGVAERDLEDQVHETFLIIHRHLADYDPSRPLRPWVLGIAYRRASDYRQLVRHERESYGEGRDPLDTSPRADDLIEVAERRAVLMRALDTLVPDRRAVIVLHDLEGLTMPEVATIVGAPLATAYSRLRIARAELAKAVVRLNPRERIW
jgi:RNA polymerase sigma-70 factor (ECF subfamily)